MDELESRIAVSTWYRVAHITGPSAIYMSLCFGVTPSGGPRLERVLRQDSDDGVVKFDLSRFLSEVTEGVAEANTRFGGGLQIEAIQIVPDDYPAPGQAKYVAYRLAKRAIEDLAR